MTGTGAYARGYRDALTRVRQVSIYAPDERTATKVRQVADVVEACGPSEGTGTGWPTTASSEEFVMSRTGAHDARMTRRIVVEVHANANEADAAIVALESATSMLNGRATYHHRHSAPCCIQAPHSAWPSSRSSDDSVTP